jgi:hypothetical protein
VGEFFSLFLNGRYDLRVAVADIHDGNATGKIDKFLTFHVPQNGTPRRLDEICCGNPNTFGYELCFLLGQLLIGCLAHFSSFDQPQADN